MCIVFYKKHKKYDINESDYHDVKQVTNNTLCNNITTLNTLLIIITYVTIIIVVRIR